LLLTPNTLEDALLLFATFKMAEIHVLTGNGAAKTTAALGVSLRALGHGKKVVFIQFMKARPTGEARIAKKLGKNFIFKQFGTKKLVNLKNPSATDKKFAKQALEFAKKVAKKEKPFLLVLDEINIATKFGLLDKKEVLEFLQSLPKDMFVYLTGRYAPKEFIKIADYVTVVKPKKYPKAMKARKGIEY